MQTVSVEIPEELARAAGWSFDNLLSPPHCGISDLEDDRRTLERLGL